MGKPAKNTKSGANKKEQTIIELIENAATTVVNSNDSVRGVPVSKGDEFRFVCTNADELKKLLTKEVFTAENNKETPYNVLNAVDGSQVSLTQLIRKRNGIDLNGDSRGERTQSLLELINSYGDEGLSIRVVKVVDVTFVKTNEDGEKEETTSKLLKFEVLNDAEEETEEETEE